MTVNVAFVYMYQLFTQQPHPGDSIALSTLSPDSPSQHPKTQDNPSLPSSRGETIRAFPSVRLEPARDNAIKGSDSEIRHIMLLGFGINEVAFGKWVGLDSRF